MLLQFCETNARDNLTELQKHRAYLPQIAMLALN